MATEFISRMGDPVGISLCAEDGQVRRVPAHVLFATLVESAVRGHGVRPDVTDGHGVAIAIPAWWTAAARSVAEDAIRERLGPRVQFVPDAIASVAGDRETAAAPRDPVAVVDVGATTSSVVLVAEAGTSRRHVASRGHVTTGRSGDHLTRLVMHHVLQGCGIDPHDLDPADPAVTADCARLLSQCETAKQDLAYRPAVEIDGTMGDVPLTVRLVRAELDELGRSWVNDVTGNLRQQLENSDLPVRRVLLVGGAAHLPMFAQAISGELGLEVTVDPHPGTLTARGAASTVASLDHRQPPARRGGPPKRGRVTRRGVAPGRAVASRPLDRGVARPSRGLDALSDWMLPAELPGPPSRPDLAVEPPPRQAPESVPEPEPSALDDGAVDELSDQPVADDRPEHDESLELDGNPESDQSPALDESTGPGEDPQPQEVPHPAGSPSPPIEVAESPDLETSDAFEPSVQESEPVQEPSRVERPGARRGKRIAGSSRRGKRVANGADVVDPPVRPTAEPGDEDPATGDAESSLDEQEAVEGDPVTASPTTIDATTLDPATADPDPADPDTADRLDGEGSDDDEPDASHEEWWTAADASADDPTETGEKTPASRRSRGALGLVLGLLLGLLIAAGIWVYFASQASALTHRDPPSSSALSVASAPFAAEDAPPPAGEADRP